MDRIIYSGCGCEAIEHFPDFCPNCRITELERTLDLRNRAIKDNVLELAELKRQIEAVKKWGEDNKSLIDYVQEMDKPTFQQALEQDDG